MDFRVSDEQRMIAETVQGALADLCAREALRKGGPFDTARWRALADLGLTGALLPEGAGGVGLDEAAFAAIARAAGTALLPEPLIDSAGVALPLLHELAGDDFAQDMAAMAAGDGHAILFHPLRRFAPHADSARLILLADEDGNLLVGPPAAFVLNAQPTVDPLTKLFTAEPGPGAQRFPAAPAAKNALALASDRGALFTAAALAGIARGVQALSVAYAHERRQFGRAIGANQAVKHMLAEVEVQLAFLTPVIEAAAALLPRQDETARAHLANARLRASRVADMATRRAVQVHGAMGYSWETDVHLFLKRALVLDTGWGDTAPHMTRVAARAFGSDIGPGALF
ncbi:MAG: acyl-CoA dehydrogenase family protein [Jhaorihella sp.]